MFVKRSCGALRALVVALLATSFTGVTPGTAGAAPAGSEVRSDGGTVIGEPFGIRVGADGALGFTDDFGGSVGRISSAAKVTTFAGASAAPEWSITPSVDAGSIAMGGVSCLNATNCWAVGDTMDAGPLVSLAEVEHWNGSRWLLVASPGPGGSLGTWLNAVSCPGVNSCYAVGGILTKADIDQGFIEHWDGSRWSVMPSPAFSGPGDVALIDVSCPSTESCRDRCRYED